MSHKKRRLEKLEERKKIIHNKIVSDKNRHHVIPSSRGGRSTDENIALIKKQDHVEYHSTFSNLTPDEVLDYLVNYIWKTKDGKTGERFILNWLKKYYDKH